MTCLLRSRISNSLNSVLFCQDILKYFFKVQPIFLAHTRPQRVNIDLTLLFLKIFRSSASIGPPRPPVQSKILTLSIFLF